MGLAIMAVMTKPPPTRNTVFAPVWLLVCAIISLAWSLFKFDTLPQQVALLLPNTGSPKVMLPSWLLANIIPALCLFLAVLIRKQQNTAKYFVFVSGLLLLSLHAGILALAIHQTGNKGIAHYLNLLPFGTVLLALAIAKIPYANKLGIRTKKTLQSPHIWQKTHVFLSQVLVADAILFWVVQNYMAQYIAFFVLFALWFSILAALLFSKKAEP